METRKTMASQQTQTVVMRGPVDQPPRVLAGARNEIQAPRGQDIQAPRGQDIQAPRTMAVATQKAALEVLR